MHLRVGVLLAAGLAVAFASPAGKKPNNDEAEVMLVPLENPLFDFEDADTGYPGGFFSFNPFQSMSGNPFSGFMQSMDDMLKNLRDQMSQVLHRLPPDNVNWSVPEGKGNTTSTTKVINGHKVTINETTYTNEGDNSGSVFKIRVVDVHPTSEEDTKNSSEEKDDEKPNEKPEEKQENHTIIPVHKDVEETTPKNVETEHEFSESSNEIPQGNKEVENEFSDNIETFDLEFDESPENYQQLPAYYNHEPMHAKPYEGFIEEIDSNDINDVNYGVRDLTNDIRVNQMMADRNAPHNPYSEIISRESYVQPYRSERLPFRMTHPIK